MNERTDTTFGAAAYGGEGWSPRTATHGQEIGTLWAGHAVGSEWTRLGAVLLHRPGGELALSHGDPNASQMLAPLDLDLARSQHDAIAEAYRRQGVTVHEVAPDVVPAPNQMFCADLVFVTPEGAILARPASIVRAGEERWVARRLGVLGVPILRTLVGTATFEGADAAWIDAETALIGRGLRTNQAGADQVARALDDIGVEAIVVDMPFGTMHLMGLLRIVDGDLAVAWPRRTPHAAIEALRTRGTDVIFLPEEASQSQQIAFNFVTLGPRRILMAAGHDADRRFLENHGIECVTVEMVELSKAAGGIGCLTAILEREPR